MADIAIDHRSIAAPIETQPRGQTRGAAMSPPRAKAEVDDGVSVNWKGATFFIQNTGALGILAAVIFWTGPRLLDLNDKLDKSIERQTIVLDAIAKGQYQLTADVAEIKNRIKGKE
jgi:hypothetical protein